MWVELVLSLMKLELGLQRALAELKRKKGGGVEQRNFFFLAALSNFSELLFGR